MKIKTALLSTLLLTTLANAEIDQKGFFVGLDLANSNVSMDYSRTSNIAQHRAYITDESENALSFKAGYQYYFTRVYARVAEFDYKDSTKNLYAIKGTTYELNLDFIPVFYMNSSKTWDIRGVVGAGIGYNTSKMYDFDTLLIKGVSTYAVPNTDQNRIEYGAQAGLMTEFDFGLSIEAGVRYREGTLVETVDEKDNMATFSIKNTEYYLGVNYLF